MEFGKETTSWRSLLWDGIQPVLAKSQDGAESLNAFTTFLKEKSKLDAQYAKGLRKLIASCKLGALELSGNECQAAMHGVSVYFDTVCNDFEKRASTCNGIAEDVVLFREKVLGTYRKLSRDANELQKRLRNGTQELNDARLSYEKASQEHEQSKTQLRKAHQEFQDQKDVEAKEPPPPPPPPPKTNDKQAGLKAMLVKGKEAVTIKRESKLQMLEAQLRSAEQNTGNLRTREREADMFYMDCVKKMRTFRVHYDNVNGHILEQLQQTEAERLSHMSFCLQHVMNLEDEMEQTQRKTMDDAVRSARRIDIEKEFKAFADLNVTGRRPDPLPVYHPSTASNKRQASSVAYIKDWCRNKKTPDSEFVEIENMVRAAGHAEIELSIEDPGLLLCISGSKEKVRQCEEYLLEVLPPGAIECKGSLSSEKAISTEEDESLFNKARSELSVLLHKIFAPNCEEDVLPAEIEAMEVWFKYPEGRSAFGRVLGEQRNREGANMRLRLSAFESLAKICLTFLDHAQASMHIAPIQLIMIMSQSFYYLRDPNEVISEGDPLTPPPSWEERLEGDEKGEGLIETRIRRKIVGGVVMRDEQDTKKPVPGSEANYERVYLQTRIKGHSIWRETQFWKEGMLLHLSTKIKVGTTGNAGVERWHSDEEQLEAADAYKKFVFSSLGTFAHNMREFDVSLEVVTDFIQKFAVLNDLPKEQTEMILMMQSMT